MSIFTEDTSIQITGDSTLSKTYSTKDNPNLSFHSRAGIYNSANNEIKFFTNGVDALTIDANQKVICNGSLITNINYNNIDGKPTLFSGSYSDLTNKPILFSGSYSDLTNKPTLFSGSYSDLTNKPTLATVATSGLYNDLLSKPTLFSGSYSDLTNKPTLATVATSGLYNDLLSKPTLFSGSYSDLTNKPTLSTVATSGLYNDLSGKPTNFQADWLTTVTNIPNALTNISNIFITSNVLSNTSNNLFQSITSPSLTNYFSKSETSNIFTTSNHIQNSLNFINYNNINNRPWIVSGSNIYNSNTANIGIGVSNPSEKLDVDGNIYCRSNVIIGPSSLPTFTGATLNSISGTNDVYLLYNGNGTLNLNSSITCDILVVGGGGSGHQRHSGGGGAGAVIYDSNVNLNSGSYTITIGAGGIADAYSPAGVDVIGNNGNDSEILLGSTVLYRAKGGGAGGGNATNANGNSGGSGGATTGNNRASQTVGSAVNTNIINGVSGFTRGNAGGKGDGQLGGAPESLGDWSGGGGGGAGEVGQDSTLNQGNSTNAGRGGNGIQISITGTSTYYGGGGGGGLSSASSGNAGAGGLGGGGAGTKGNAKATSGTANTGGGGGGGGYSTTGTDNGLGGDGGSGVVIIRIKIKNQDVKLLVNGETLVNSNLIISHLPFNFINNYSNSSLLPINNTKENYLLYSSNGSLTLNEPFACDLLVVGAGGNGGLFANSGGGGAGEIIYFPNFPLRAGILNITVGITSSIYANRTSKISLSGGSDLITARGGGNGGTILYSTSGGTVSALTPITGTNDAYITITAGTTLILNKSLICDVLVVGGGGSGHQRHSGGGGAGAVIYDSNVNLNSGSYTITIGAGGIADPYSPAGIDLSGNNGNDSEILLGSTVLYRAKGGGAGAGNGTNVNANSGGSGGATTGNNRSLQTVGSAVNTNIINGVSGFTRGNAGGKGDGDSGGAGESLGDWSGGGGGGAGEVGQNSTLNQGNSTNAGRGGNGIQISITGTSTYYGGGGGGGLSSASSGNAGAGGLGGGGAGTKGNAKATSGTANTGGGGGGGGYSTTGTDNGLGGDGGSGVVIIRFKDYYTEALPTVGGSGGGGAINQLYALNGVKFDEYKSFSSAGFSGNASIGGNGGSALTVNRYTTTITGSSLSVGLGGSGVSGTPTPVVKTNYGDGGDGNGGLGASGVVIIRFKEPQYLSLKAIKDNANTGLIINANEDTNKHQLRVFPWSDTYASSGIPTRGWSFRCHDGIANGLDLINLFSYFGGRVGIKTKNPSASLDVDGDFRCKTFNTVGNELYGITCQVVNEHASGEASINVIAGQAGSYGGLSVVYIPSTNLGYVSSSKSLQIKTANNALNSYIYINDTTGNIGIGLTNPASKLGVNGMITTNDIQVNNGLNATIISSGQLYSTSIDTNLINNLNGTITNVNNLFTSNLYINNAIDMQNKYIYNCAYLYGGATYCNEWEMNTNVYHNDDQGRARIYFKNDTTGSPPNHFTLFKSGSYSHIFADKDDTQYCILDRFGISTYFEVISGSGYDNIGCPDASSTGVYVYRRMFIRLSTFTEVHRCFCEDELYINYDDFINEFVGRVVVSKGKIKTALKEAGKDWQILEGKDGITIDDSHPVVELSRKKKDKAVVGVITKRNQNNDLPNRLVINSLGETGIFVVNTGGNIENGSLITTSDEIGYGQLQTLENGEPDDIIRSYTIGKSMIDCSFELDNPNYKCEVIDINRDLRRVFLPIFIYSG